MQVALIILAAIVVYVVFLSLCRMAAVADSQASRYRRRTQQARTNVQYILSVAPAGNSRVEVFGGR